MWTIHLVKNTVVIPEKKRAAVDKLLWDACPEYFPWDEEPAIHNDGTLIFDQDAFEHMDWLCRNEKACEIIALSGVSGIVQFASLEGDNAGDFWGVSFEDKTYQLLDGHIVYFTVGDKKCPKKKR